MFDPFGFCHRPAISPRFGEVAHAPPDLAKIPRPRGFKDQGQAKPWARQAAANAGAAAGSGGRGVGLSGEGFGGNRGSGNQKQSHQQQHKKKGKINNNNTTAVGGEDGQEEEEEGAQRQRAAEAKKAQTRQMEEMRQRVQEAYSGLKKKRRAGQTQFVGSDL